MSPVDPYQPLIKVRWPHGGWLVWNWHFCKWDRMKVAPASALGKSDDT